MEGFRKAAHIFIQPAEYEYTWLTFHNKSHEKFWILKVQHPFQFPTFVHISHMHISYTQSWHLICTYLVSIFSRYLFKFLFLCVIYLSIILLCISINLVQSGPWSTMINIKSCLNLTNLFKPQCLIRRSFFIRILWIFLRLASNDPKQGATPYMYSPLRGGTCKNV